jgi:hypothetical protein
MEIRMTDITQNFKAIAEQEELFLQERMNSCRQLGITARAIARNTGLPYPAINLFYNNASKKPSYVVARTLDLYLQSINL